MPCSLPGLFCAGLRAQVKGQRAKEAVFRNIGADRTKTVTDAKGKKFSCFHLRQMRSSLSHIPACSPQTEAFGLFFAFPPSSKQVFCIFSVPELSQKTW